MKNTISALAANHATFQALFSKIPDAEIHWRSAPEKWNLLEIACHLRDEEVDDWRTRVKTTLETPETDPPGIDPAAWVKERDYASQDFNVAVRAFLHEREVSIDYLRHLKDPQWDNGYDHPSLGRLTAAKFLTNWLAHDYLHIRQIIKTRYLYLKAHGGESLDYAGGW